MSTMTPVPKDHPLAIAWAAYQKTEDFANASQWATVTETTIQHPYLQGSLWAMFMEGYKRGSGIGTAKMLGCFKLHEAEEVANAAILKMPKYVRQDNGEETVSIHNVRIAVIAALKEALK